MNLVYTGNKGNKGNKGTVPPFGEGLIKEMKCVK